MFPALPLPSFTVMTARGSQCAGGHFFRLLAAPANLRFGSGSYVIPGLSLMGETK